MQLVKRRHRSFLTLKYSLALVVVGGVVTGQSQSGRPGLSPEMLWQRGADAWESGRYPTALEDLREVMRSPGAADYLDRIALLTGELYPTTELTLDGRNPQISGNGEYASYETGPATSPRTVVVRVSPAPQVVVEIATAGVVLDRAGRRAAWLRELAPDDALATEIVVRDLASGVEHVLLGAGMAKSSIAWSGDDQSIIFLGATVADHARNDVYSVREGSAPVALTAEPGFKAAPIVDQTGATLIYMEVAASPLAPNRGGLAGPPGTGASRTFRIVSLADKTTHKIVTPGLNAMALSADGSTVAWTTRDGDNESFCVAPTRTAKPIVVRNGGVSFPSLSPDGRHVAYQIVANIDRDIYVSTLDGGPPSHRRVTRDIQDDLRPRFLNNTMLFFLRGEGRHRRSYLYDLATGQERRLFANNSIRTISPEYAWVPSATGQHLIIRADRDGDTVSPETAISVVDLTRTITRTELLARLDRQLAEESDLRARMTRAFQPVSNLTHRVLSGMSVNRLFAYERALFDFDSKAIARPGNLQAIEYLEQTYRSFGYEPAVQWFTPKQLEQTRGRTANIIATLRGTENPNLIYVVGSHFDSTVAGPGADDNASGTAALLETARVLSTTPLPATVVFASFTGEEESLLGSREFVRLAAQNKWNVVGALNNDMIGWSADGARLDNTIRYSNAGIRDVQHGAAFLFTDLVLFDARYVQNTDAESFLEAWGDIVGGIGSYPVLANPNYHRATDLLETLNHRQVLETAKVTVATLIQLASSPSPVRNLRATRTGTTVDVSWTPSPEAGVKSYVVAYGPAATRMRTRRTVGAERLTLSGVPADTQFAVTAVNARGMEGWDWARTVLR